MMEIMERTILYGIMVFLGIIVLLFLIGIILSFFLNGIGGSQGTHVGYVTAIEFNDNIIWDANLVYFKTDLESTQEDSYCVNDGLLKFNLENAQINKQKISIDYANNFWFWRKDCHGGVSIITGFKEAKE